MFSTTAIISPCVPEDAQLDLIQWSPSGNSFAIASSSEIHIISNPLYSTTTTLNLDTKCRAFKYSPNGMYLAAINYNGIFYMFNMANNNADESPLMFKKGIESPLHDLVWDPKANGICLVQLLAA